MASPTIFQQISPEKILKTQAVTNKASVPEIKPNEGLQLKQRTKSLHIDSSKRKKDKKKNKRSYSSSSSISISSVSDQGIKSKKFAVKKS